MSARKDPLNRFRRRRVLSIHHCVCRLLVGAGLLFGFRSATAAEPGSRVRYAVERLNGAFAQAGLASRAEIGDGSHGGVALVRVEGLAAEHFKLRSISKGVLQVEGSDDSGLLYGALALEELVNSNGRLPDNIDVSDGPEFKLRGMCVGMQQLVRGEGSDYLWPYTPENFAFFYDKARWIRHLDLLLSLRMNSLYLWNGHPFASLVKVADYPEALEVSPEVLAKNREMYLWLADQCDKRGICLIQMFYNIHLPQGVATKYQLSKSLSKPDPVASDYTRKSIAAFVESFPKVGLMLCLGEALDPGPGQVEWFTQTILPGVKDGLKARGQEELPPIVVRGHHIVEGGTHKEVIGQGKAIYPNLYTMGKFNGESLTTWEPRGTYQQYHRELAAASGMHLVNVHLLSNLEPFRYAGFDFISKSAKAIRDRLDGNGVHIYPLSFWGWPVAPDSGAELDQLERDLLWYEAWARYSWKVDRNPVEEREFWISRLETIYGDRQAARLIYQAYNAAGECAPRLLRRFGITGGNRQALALGMTLDQMVNAERYKVWKDLRGSDSPLGEDLREYVSKEWQQLPHQGETPPQIIEETTRFAARAVENIDAAASRVKRNQAEFVRLQNDIHCIGAMTAHYTNMAGAALKVLRYELSKDPADLRAALPLLESSFTEFQKLSEMAGPAYRYAASFHGRQKIPWPEVWHWSQVVGRYAAELDSFRKSLSPEAQKAPLPAAEKVEPVVFKLFTPGMETYTVGTGAKVFTDCENAIVKVVPELSGLTGIRFARARGSRPQDGGIDFETSVPVSVLVGYFKSQAPGWLQVPDLEHASHADDRGGYTPRWRSALTIDGFPDVDVHVFRFEPGRQRLELIGSGSYLVLGFVARQPAAKN